MHFVETANKNIPYRRCVGTSINKLFAKREVTPVGHFDGNGRSAVYERCVGFHFIPPLHNFAVN